MPLTLQTIDHTQQSSVVRKRYRRARTLRDMLHPASKLAAMLRPRSHRFALESRQLFDGAALVEAAHATDAPDAAHEAKAITAPCAG